MSDDQFNRVAFVYRSKEDGIRVVGFLQANVYKDNPQWKHLATIDSFQWIEYLLRNTTRERAKQINWILK